MIRGLLIVAALGVAVFTAPVVAQDVAQNAAKNYPDKPIRIVVPFSPGGGTDILARQLAEALARSEQWNVVVENRPGGIGAIALTAIARAPADGYQIILALRENIAIAPLIAKHAGETLNFDPLGDFTAIAHVADAPMVLVAHPQSGYGSMVTVIEAAKARPDTLRFGTSGRGSMSHLLLALLGQVSGATMVNIPYRGTNPALTDLIGEHLDLVGGSIASAKSFIESGRLRPVAVSSLDRVAALPDVPTIAELGYPGFNVATWYALFGPAGMPQDVVKRINAATNKVIAAPDFQGILRDQGMYTRIGTPEAFEQWFRDDYAELDVQIKNLNMAQR